MQNEISLFVQRKFAHSGILANMKSSREHKAITKAIIPTAGLGTRMEPFTKVIPKEMLPLGRKPVLAYIVEELQAGGIEEILVVTRADKPAIREYFKSWHGIYFIEENQARGSGYAILMGKDFVGKEDFLVALADAPLWEERPGSLISDLAKVHSTYQAAITMAIYQIPWGETYLRGIMMPAKEVVPGKAVKLLGMIEKPTPETAPSKWAGVGRYIFSPDIFSALESLPPDKHGERGVTSGIQRLVQEGKAFYGYPLREGQKRFDVGNYEGYVEALMFYAARTNPALTKY
jgi:UTP--glucose-1-phosphate uridylyltransferase